MAALAENDDLQAIRSLIGAHFQGLHWTPTASADWETFSADFLPDASLFPVCSSRAAANARRLYHTHEQGCPRYAALLRGNDAWDADPPVSETSR